MLITMLIKKSKTKFYLQHDSNYVNANIELDGNSNTITLVFS